MVRFRKTGNHPTAIFCGRFEGSSPSARASRRNPATASPRDLLRSRRRSRALHPIRDASREANECLVSTPSRRGGDGRFASEGASRSLPRVEGGPVPFAPHQDLHRSFQSSHRPWPRTSSSAKSKRTCPEARVHDRKVGRVAPDLPRSASTRQEPGESRRTPDVVLRSPSVLVLGSPSALAWSCCLGAPLPRLRHPPHRGSL